MPLHLHLPPVWNGRVLPVHVVCEAAAYFFGYQAFLFARQREGDVLPPGRRLAIIATAAAGALIGSKLPGVWTSLAHPAHTAGASPGGPLPAWLSGKTVAGGILFGWLAVEAAKKAMGIRVRTGDAFVFPLCLALVIGRLGCFLAGLPDGTQGLPSGLPWAIDYGDGVPRHPSPLYEIAFVSALAAALWRWRKGIAPGARFALFLLAYFPFRVAADFLKPDPAVALGLSAVQWTCLAGLLLALAHLRRGRDIAPPSRVQQENRLVPGEAR